MGNSYAQFRGIIPALITPYNEEGQICESAARKLIERLIGQGVAGLYISGSTGEGVLQTIKERKNFLETVIGVVGGRIPVIAQVGALDTASSMALAKHAAASGADAVSAVAPFYYKHRPEQIRQHYLDIVNAADIPLIIYHIPAFTGSGGSVEFYRELSHVEGIIGVKYTSNEVFEMQQMIDRCGEDFLVFNGQDEVCIAGLLMGCCGAIGSTYNIMASSFVSLYKSFHSGNINQARTIQFEVNKVIVEMLKYDFIAFEREILRLQGCDVGNPRKPLQQLTDDQREEIRGIVARFPFLLN